MKVICLQKFAVLVIISFFIFSTIHAYPMGFTPGSQEICIDSKHPNSTAYVNIQSGANETLNFSVAIFGLDWASFGNNTTSGLVEIPNRSNVDVAIYFDVPANLSKGIYNTTFQLCNTPLNGSAISTIFCIEGNITANMTEMCPVQNQTTTQIVQTHETYYIPAILAVLIGLVLIFVLNKLIRGKK
jgi:hypothetical protein